MATRNDYLLLEQKCLKHYELAYPYFFSKKNNLDFSREQQARFGFYYFILKMCTELTEYHDITKIITDTDFNTKLFDNPNPDEGIDAVYIDEERNEIKLFNFKYRGSFNPSSTPSKDDALKSSKFFSVLLSQKNNLTGPMKNNANQIIKKLNSNDVWNIIFYIVSNDNIKLEIEDPNIEQIKNLYGINIVSIGLDEIVEATSLHPRQIDATILLPKESIMSFKENSLSSDISYIFTLPLTELIRITCDDSDLRNKYNLENAECLEKVKLDYQILYDNVRGFLGATKFNKNIECSLGEDPQKFFFYNNGITIIADDITTEEINVRAKIKLCIKNMQVLNGGQTLRTIHNYNLNNKTDIIEKLSTAQVLVKLLKVTNDDLKGHIAEYTNSQNAISQRDLKSLRKEQILLEEYLSDYGIYYERKRGSIGITEKDFHSSISIELMGQILLAIDGYPERISNKKREIFNSYYETLFASNASLLSEETVRFINQYHEIEKEYHNSSFKDTTQKNMYILYLCHKFNKNDYLKVISIFEKYLDDYPKKNNIKMSDDKNKALSRFLIESSFRESITKDFPKVYKD